MSDSTTTETSSYKLYIVDFWVPFPSSEYGGLILVTATSDEDAIQCLREGQYECVYTEQDKEGIEEAVKEAKRFELAKGDYTTEIVDKFIT